MGSKSLTAISRPLLASWASSSGCLIVPNGPPVFVWTSKVPAECHLQHRKKKTIKFINIQFHRYTKLYANRNGQLTPNEGRWGHSSSQQWALSVSSYISPLLSGTPCSQLGSTFPYLYSQQYLQSIISTFHDQALQNKANWTQNWSYLVVDHELQTLLVYCTMRWLKRHELNTSLSSFCSRARKWDIFIEREPKEDSSARFGPLALFTLDRAAKIELYFQFVLSAGALLLSGSWKGQLAGQRLDTCAWDYGCQVIHSLLVRRAYPLTFI